MVLGLVLLLACAAPQAPEQKQPAPSAPVAPSPAEKVVVEEKTEPQPAPAEVPPGPLETTGWVPEPYSQLGCEQLVTEAMFTTPCQSKEEVVITARIGTNNCHINIKSREYDRRTAGVVLEKFDSAEKAMAELRRRAGMRQRGVGDAVGDGEYQYEQVDANVIDFAKGSSIVSVRSDERLCSKENLVEFAKSVAGKLQ